MWLIIAGSIFFYGYWNPSLTWVPCLLILLSYFGGFWLGRPGDQSARRIRLTVMVVLLLLPLAIFKYTNFIYLDILGPLTGATEELLNIPLPLGISFVTFTMIAYLVDIYRGDYRVERRLGTFSGFTLFFPQLIAGPILRPKELIPQLDRPDPREDRAFTVGLSIFTLGLFKKVVFADVIAEAVQRVYEGGGPFSAWDYLTAIFGFSVQIYCDFSGYTDMALGIAVILGINLPNNFSRPYLAVSADEFWRKWHITLSNWIRDYLYIPLGGNRQGPAAQVRNLMVAMGLCGLWHGANWTFVAWGLLHGLGIVACHMSRRLRPKGAERTVPAWLGVALTFLFVTAAWILFRSPDMDTVVRVACGPFSAGYAGFSGFFQANKAYLLIIGAFLLTHPLDSHDLVRRFVRKAHPLVFWYTLATAWVVAIGVAMGGTAAKFIYFDF